MKNIIFTAFIIFTFTYKPVYAAFNVYADCGLPPLEAKPNCSEALTSNNCAAMGGCYFNSDTQKCTIAPTGKYAIVGSNQLSDCNLPSYGEKDEFSWLGYWDGSTQFGFGMSSNNCPWYTDCETDEYWNKSRCTKCNSVPGYIAKTNNETKRIIGCLPNFSDDNDFWDRCTPEPFSVTLNPLSPYRDDLAEFNIYVKYNSSDTTQDGGFSNSATASSWSAQPGQTLILPRPNLEWWNKPDSNGTEYGFLGYTQGPTEKYITGNGNLPPDTSIADFEPDMELTGVWQDVYYDVVYYTTDGTEHARLDNININTLTLPSGDTAMPYADGPAIDGKLFIGWTCNLPRTCNPQSGQQNCIKTCDVATVELTDEMPRPSSGKYEALYTDSSPTHQINVNLYPLYTDCPAGYFCTNNHQEKCPGGTTSRQGSSLITDCYMSADSTTGTLLKDNFGQIPLSILTESDIYYKQN